MKDLYNNCDTVAALTTQTISTDTTTAGEIIDLQGHDGVLFVFQSGTITDGAYAVLIESGDDSGLSDAAAVADEHLLGTEAGASFAATDDDTVTKVGVRARHGKRYVRASLVSTGTSSGGEFSATAVLGNLVRP